MPFDCEKSSNLLAALRAERGPDQAGLAERAGVSRDSIVRYETGGAVPNIESACRLADPRGRRHGRRAHDYAQFSCTVSRATNKVAGQGIRPLACFLLAHGALSPSQTHGFLAGM